VTDDRACRPAGAADADKRCVREPAGSGLVPQAAEAGIQAAGLHGPAVGDDYRDTGHLAVHFHFHFGQAAAGPGEVKPDATEAAVCDHSRGYLPPPGTRRAVNASLEDQRNSPIWWKRGRQVGGEGSQIGVGRGAQRLSQPDVQLGEIDAALSRRIPQSFHHSVALGIGSAQPARRAGFRELSAHMADDTDKASPWPCARQSPASTTTGGRNLPSDVRA